LAKLFWKKFGEVDYQLSLNFREWNFVEGMETNRLGAGVWGLAVAGGGVPADRCWEVGQGLYTEREEGNGGFR
jgi:hypothetical protein